MHAQQILVDFQPCPGVALFMVGYFITLVPTLSSGHLLNKMPEVHGPELCLIIATKFNVWV